MLYIAEATLFPLPAIVTSEVSVTLVFNHYLKQSALSSTVTLEDIVVGCKNANRDSQKLLYKQFFSMAMGICMRYSNNYAEAEEIVNDSFLKIFKKVNNFEPAYQNYDASFTGWIKKIIIYTAIDSYRKNERSRPIQLIDEQHLEIMENSASSVDNMSYKEIIELVQKLSPVYRSVFNLYVLDGYKHEEIANMLGISVGTSKSNLAKARMNIQKMLGQKKIKLYEQRKAI